MHTRLFFGMLVRLPSLLFRKQSYNHIHNQESHWATLQEKGSVSGMLILVWIYRHLGRLPFLLVLHPVILYFSLSSGEARKASRQFVVQIQTVCEHNLKPGWKTTYRHFYNFGVSALDKIACWIGEIQRSDVNIHGREHFEALLAAGKGAVFFGSHLGNIEISRALGEKGGRFKMNAMVFNKNALKFQRVLARSNPQAEVNLIHVETIGIDTAIMLKQKIDDGEIIIIVGDRTPVHGITRIQNADFLGKPAPFPEGPFIMASLLECPVYLLFCLKEQGKYNVYLEPFADCIKLPRNKRSELLAENIQRYANRLAWFCKKEPLQWFNFHDFWQHDSTIGKQEPRLQLNSETKPE
jgi:predicted LPLAT superfamily acyltransferase